MDYLRAYSADHLDVEWIEQELVRRNGTGELAFTILDLSNDESCRLRIVPRFDGHVETAARVVTNLRQPLANVAVQIVLWEINGIFEEDTLNALGLGLRISPPFFRALRYSGRPSLDPRYVRIGGVVATIVRQYRPEKPDAVPIVLIACPHRDAVLAKDVDWKIRDVSPFLDPAIDTYSHYSHLHDPALSTRVDNPRRGWHTDYVRILELCLKKEKQAAEGAAPILKPLMPLLYTRIVLIRHCCETIRQKYRAVHKTLLY